MAEFNNVNSVLGNGYIIGSDLYVCVSTNNGDVNDYTNVGQIQGPSGAQGAIGTQGNQGLQGAQGPVGNDGAQGPQGGDGTNGANGTNGTDGSSAYEVAVANGFVGTEAAWLLSLVGADGTAGQDGAQGPAGQDGATGGYITHTVGESYGGGIVFYVYDGGQHGLIAATDNQAGATKWYAGSNSTTLAKGDGINAGKANTSIIISSQGLGDGITYAASICNEYSVIVNGVTYGDWYLPSKYELNLLYLQRGDFGNFGTNTYWSSTEFNNNTAFKQAFANGNQFAGQKSSNSGIRAVRAF